MRRGIGLLALLLVCGLSLSGCSLFKTGTKATPPPKPQAVGTIPEDLQPFYNQHLNWKPCPKHKNMDCANAKVPLDYKNPTGDSIEIALLKIPASGDKIGTLWTNPGGPGGSGIDFVADSAEVLFTPKLLNAYDIIGFDPRGVGKSDPIKCLDDAQLDAVRSASYPDTAEGRAEALKQQDEISKGCEERSPKIIKFADTGSVVRDLDILRAANGDSSLNYLGYSYGTYLGLRYAELFPDRVGRMTLDGVLDPTATYGDVAAAQAKGFEDSLGAFVEFCLKSNNCPLNGSVEDGKKQIRQYLDRLLEHPQPTTDAKRPLTQSLALSAIFSCLYGKQLWALLQQTLNQAMTQNDGSGLLRIADVYADREDNGKYSTNSDEAFWVINSLDYHPTGTMSDWEKQAAQIEKIAPTIGFNFTYSEATLEHWPNHAPEARQWDGTKIPPVLLVGTTHDPATPYSMAKKVRSLAPKSVLLTWDGWDHTAYGHGSDCINSNVDGFMLTGKLPTDGTECK